MIIITGIYIFIYYDDYILIFIFFYNFNILCFAGVLCNLMKGLKKEEYYSLIRNALKSIKWITIYDVKLL